MTKFLPLTEENLIRYFALSHETAQRLLNSPKHNVSEFLDKASEEVGGFYAEFVSIGRFSLLYINKENPHEYTIMYDEDTGNFFIGTLADWLAYVEFEDTN